jgi:hemolysin activation/secretion protein
MIEGSTIHDAPALFPAYRAHLGRPVTDDGARFVARSIADLYYESGYVRPVVRVDSALARQGILRFRVEEPWISRVALEGEPGRHRERIERIAASVRASRPLRRGQRRRVRTGAGY